MTSEHVFPLYDCIQCIQILNAVLFSDQAEKKLTSEVVEQNAELLCRTRELEQQLGCEKVKVAQLTLKNTDLQQQEKIIIASHV